MGSRTCEDDDDDDDEGEEEAVQHPPLPPAPQRWWVEEPGGAWWRPETLRSESSAVSRVSPSVRRTDTDRNHQSGHRVVEYVQNSSFNQSLIRWKTQDVHMKRCHSVWIFDFTEMMKQQQTSCLYIATVV